AKPSVKLGKPRGQPPNMVAHLVILDIAEIFLWATGQRATRCVDRIDGTETGAFFKFAETLWPIVFDGSDGGLKNTMNKVRLAHDRARRRDRRGTHDCQMCGETFEPTRTDAKFCSAACKQKAYRKRYG